MGCSIIRNDKNQITEVFVREGKGKVKKDASGKPIESLLFKNLVSPATGNQTLGLPESVALTVWMATNSDLFKKRYGGKIDENGEPIFSLGKDSANTVYAYFEANDGTQLLRVDVGSKSKRLAYEENTDIISETIGMDDFIGEPVLPEMVDYLMTFSQKQLLQANQSISAALNMVTDADAWEKAKEAPDYEKKNFRINAQGQKERFDDKGHTLSGTSFNGNNQPQHFINGFDPKRWNESLSMGENLANLFWSREGIKKEDKLMFDQKLMSYAEFVEEKNRLFYRGTDKGTIIHLRNQRMYARNQAEKERLTEKIEEAIEAANERNESKGDAFKLSENAYSFIEEQTAQDTRLGINQNSIVFFEKIIHAPIMGVHGIVDKMIVRPDGKITMTEIKTTGFLNQDNKTFMFFNSDTMGDLAVQLEASTLNKAKIQLVMNMMATALTYPGVRFSLCGIENLANANQAKMDGFIALSKRDVSDIMKMLLSFYRNEKEKGKSSAYSHIYDQLMALDSRSIKDIYLNPENVDAYVDSVELKYEKKGDKRVLVAMDKSEDRLAELERRLVRGVGMHADMNKVSQYIKLEAGGPDLGKRFDFKKDIQEILAIFSNQGDDPAIFNDDISWANKWIGGTTSNVSHPVIQIYNEYFHSMKIKRDKAALALRTKYDAHFVAAFNVWARANGQKEFSGTNKFSERFFTSGTATQFWNHFYKEVDLGTYKKTVRLRQDEVTGAEDKALLKFLDDYYESVLSDDYLEREEKIGKDGKPIILTKKAFIYQDATYTIDNRNNPQLISHLGVYQGKGWKMGNTNNWNWKAITSLVSDTGQNLGRIPFTPFTSMLPYEYEQRYEWEKDSEGKPIKSPSALVKLKNTFLKHISGFFDKQDNYKGASDTRMVELKYMGSESENISNYSLDLGAQFGKFMENIESKRYMDTVLAVAEAIATHSENTLKDRGYNENQINIADWLRKQARWQIKGESPDDDPVANNRALAKELFRIPMAIYDDKRGKYKEYIITLHTLLRGMRTFASYVHMSINPKGSLLNAAQAIFTSLKMGWSLSAAHTFIGMKKEAIDLKATDYAMGLKMWSKMQESAINGDPMASKLYLLAKEMAYLPSDYSYFDVQDSFGLNPNSWKNPSGLMVLHSAVEEANSLAILYAQLKSLKIGIPDPITGERKSAWDMYSVDSTEKVAGQTIHKLVWEDNFNRGLSYQKGAMRPTYGLQPQEVIKMKRVYERMQGNYRHEERSILEMYVLGQVVMQFKRYLPSMIRGQLRGRTKDPSLGRFVEVQRDGESILEWRGRMITGKYILLMNWFFGGVLRPLMHKIPATKGQFKHMTDEGAAKNRYLFAKQLSFQEMSEDEQAMIMDAMISFTFYLSMALAGLKMEDESGKKDPWYLFLENINSTMIQPWNLFKMLDTVKSGLSPVSFNVFVNILMGTGEFLHRGFQVGLGYEDSMYNDKGNVPGLRKIGTSIPLTKGFSNTYDLLVRRGAKGNEE